jgi:hypothetical protein
MLLWANLFQMTHIPLISVSIIFSELRTYLPNKYSFPFVCSDQDFILFLIFHARCTSIHWILFDIRTLKIGWVTQITKLLIMWFYILLLCMTPAKSQVIFSIFWFIYFNFLGRVVFLVLLNSMLAHLRFRNLGQFFMEPSDFYDAPIFKVLHFIRSVGLIKG